MIPWLLVFVLCVSLFSAAHGAESAEGSEAPVVSAGKFAKVYDPGIGEERNWYINDHCFIRGEDGVWHMFGITHEEPLNPNEEILFAHATAKSLMQLPWTKQPHALTASPEHGEVHLWAPHVIRHDGTYYMYYCAGGKEAEKYRIHLATSKDLKTWTRHADNPLIQDGFHARDPMVLRVGDKWVMYYTANAEPSGGNHIVAYRTSDDLIRWSERKTAFTDPAKGTFGGPTESPFVVRRGPYYYLFIGPRGGYNGTDIFRSVSPYTWDIKDQVGHIPSHAAEVLRDTDGKWYVSRCGWEQGGLYLAPLFWNDGQDKAETSMPPGG